MKPPTSGSEPLSEATGSTATKMERSDAALLRHAKNETSQFGEDGIVEEIFVRISPHSRTCIEFGAWDGKHLSNTYRLWKNLGWSALLIEGDATRFEELKRTTAGNALVTPLNAYVAPTGANSLEALIKGSGFQSEPDLLCIDIDGDDYHILCSLEKCRPRVLIVEYNPTIPPDMDLFQLPGGALGSSAAAIVRAGLSKGYKLACMTDSNCIFVRADEFHKLGIPVFDHVGSFPNRYLSCVVSDYRGNLYLTSQPVYAPQLPTFKAASLYRQWKHAAEMASTRSGTEPQIASVQMFKWDGK